MSECKLGTYEGGGDFGRAFVSHCGCPNCTKREAQVLAEANAKRKALLALDAAMKDLATSQADAYQQGYEACDEREILTGRICNANDAWAAARHYILP